MISQKEGLSMTQKASVRMEEIRRRTRRLRQRRAHRINCTLSAVCLFLTVGIASLLYQEHVPGLSIVLAGYGSVLLHSGADAYIVVSVGSFVTGVVFTLLGIRYRRYKTLHRPFSPDAADKASSQSLSDELYPVRGAGHGHLPAFGLCQQLFHGAAPVQCRDHRH